jgi:uncharacterized protein (TIGR02246 family)
MADSKNAIREIIEARNRAVSDGDADAIVANLADDVVTFDVVPPLVSKGKDSARKRAVEWLDNYDGKVCWDVQDVQIVADGNTAFAHFISHVTGTLKSGNPMDMWFRTTLGFRVIEDAWRIVHDHSSDPFDPESGKAMTDLRP